MNRKTLAAIATFLIALGGLLGALIESGGGDATKTIATVNTTAPATPAQVAKAPPAGELQSEPEDISALRDSTPDGVPKQKLEDAEQAADAYVEEHGVEDADTPIAQGGAQGYSCRKSYQSRGYGSYRSAFTQFVLHYTVSPNAPGWQDVYNIKSYLNSVGLSATFVMDFEGHCLQTVPLDRNPYTQGGMNQYSVSVEIIATGRESVSDWTNAPIIKQGILAALVRDVLKSHNLPVRFVDPVGCVPKGGYSDHNHQECGNNHVDVSPNFPWSVFNRQVQAAPKPVCGKRCRHVKHVRARHQRTHRLIEARHCSEHHSKKGYCERLRNRNRYMHKVAKRDHVSLKGTYR